MTVHLNVGSPLSDRQPLCYGRTAPEISEEEGSYASRFFHWFLESLRVRFNWNSCTVASLKVPAMIVYNKTTKVLGKK